MRARGARPVAAALLLLAACCSAAPAKRRTPAHHGSRLLIRVARGGGSGDAAVGAAAASASAAGVGELRLVSTSLGVYTVEVLDGSSPAAKARQLSEMPGIQYAELDLEMELAGRVLSASAPPPPSRRPQRPPRPPYTTAVPRRRVRRRPPTVVPNDTYWAQQWGPLMMNAPLGWAVQRSAGSVRVCLVDSGVAWDHPDLAPALVPMSDAYRAANADGYGHGTHVAGIVGAVAGNGVGVAGVGFNVSLLACKALSDAGKGYVSDVVGCIDTCRGALGAHIINLSMVLLPFSTATDVRTLNASVKAATGRGVLLVSAAGNSELDLDSYRVYPPSFGYPGLVAVANVAQDGRLCPASYDGTEYGSNWGAATVHVAAPGTSILSTYNAPAWNGAPYRWMTGTSMAAPAVAGAAALALAASGGRLTAAQLQALLVRTARPLPGLVGKCVAEGVVDMHRLLLEARAFAG